MNEIILTRKQAQDIWKIFKNHKDLDQVKLIETNTTGIGANMHIEYVAVEDITDVSNW